MRFFKEKCQNKKYRTRHGKKLYEVLLNTEEVKKVDRPRGGTISSSDNRDRNYSKYFEEGENKIVAEGVSLS